jgi:hypothetical protein
VRNRGGRRRGWFCAAVRQRNASDNTVVARATALSLVLQRCRLDEACAGLLPFRSRKHKFLQDYVAPKAGASVLQTGPLQNENVGPVRIPLTAPGCHGNVTRPGEVLAHPVRPNQNHEVKS